MPVTKKAKALQNTQKLSVPQKKEFFFSPDTSNKHKIGTNQLLSAVVQKVTLSWKREKTPKKKHRNVPYFRSWGKHSRTKSRSDFKRFQSPHGKDLIPRKTKKKKLKQSGSAKRNRLNSSSK